MAGLLDPMKGDGTYVENRPSKGQLLWGILGPYVTEPFNAMERLWNSPAIKYGFQPTEQDVADSFNIAGSIVGAGSVVPKPANAVGMAMTRGSFPGSKLPTVDALAKAQSKGKFVYHSGVADDVPSMQYGIDPQVGPWVREIYEGSVDDEIDIDEMIENATPLAWWSKAPEWVKIKVARKLDKQVSDVSEEDILSHGHLAILPKKEPDAENLYWVGEDGLNMGPWSKVKDITGREVDAARAGLYDNGDPMGVEKNEYVSTRSIEPYLQLTGPELLEFLKKTGMLNGSPGLLDGGNQ